MLNRIVLSKVLSILFLASVVVAEPALTTGPGMELLLQGTGLVLLLVAAFGRTWCSLHIAGRKTTELVTHGPYSVVRHPLYFFSLVGFIGGGLALELVTAGVGFAIIFVVTHVPTMRAEEAKLEKLYGQTYRDYMARVPRLIPSLSQYQDRQTLEVYTAKFNRAMIEAALIALSFLIVLIVHVSREHGWLPTFWKLI